MTERNTRVRASQIRSILPSDIDATNALGAGVDGYVPSYNDSESKFTWVDISASVTLQNAFDNGNSITIADGDNQTLNITNNDTTNNSKTLTINNIGSGVSLEVNKSGASNTGACASVNNAGTGHGIYVGQNGVLASTKHGLYVYSNAVQVNSAVAFIEQDHASSTANVMEIQNDGTGNCLDLDQNGNGRALSIHNSGTSYGLFINQAIASLDNTNAFRVYSNAVQTGVNSYLAYIHQDNASSTTSVLAVSNDGTGDGIRIDQNGNGVGLNINNDGTSYGLYIHQDGVLASSTYGLYVYSNVAQTASDLVAIHQDNASSTRDVVNLDNDGTGHGIYINQAGVLALSKYALYVNSSAVQTNSPLVYTLQDNASSTANVSIVRNDGTGIGFVVDQNGNGNAFKVDNAGTDHGIYVDQNGVLASSKYGLYVYSNAVQTASYLGFIKQTNSSSTASVFGIQNNGIGGAFVINQNGNGIGLQINNSGTNQGCYIAQLATNTANDHGLQVATSSPQTNTNTALALFYANGDGSTEPVVEIHQDHASATSPALEIRQDGNGVGLNINNNGTNHGLYIHQDGVLASTKHGLYVYSNVAQTTSSLVHFENNNASTTKRVLEITQNHASSNGQCLYIKQDGIGAGIAIDQAGNGSNGLFIGEGGVAKTLASLLKIRNGVSGTTYPLAEFIQDHASSTANVMEIQNDGTGIGFVVDQNGNGNAFKVDNAGTDHGIYVDQNGVLASSKYALYVYSNAEQDNSSLVFIHQDNAGSNYPSFHIQNDGLGHGILVDGNNIGPGISLDQGGNGPHLRLTGDPTVASPLDGDLWFDGTNLKIHIGSTTYTLDKTSV